jgi:hypothetical protein
VEILQDLRDLAAHRQQTAAFRTRLQQLCARHARKTGRMQRLDRAGLPNDPADWDWPHGPKGT